MKYYEIKANITKLDILGVRAKLACGENDRPYLVGRKGRLRKMRVEHGPMWRYRNRRIIRNLHFNDPWWNHKVRRKLRRGDWRTQL